MSVIALIIAVYILIDEAEKIGLMYLDYLNDKIKMLDERKRQIKNFEVPREKIQADSGNYFELQMN